MQGTPATSERTVPLRFSLRHLFIWFTVVAVFIGLLSAGVAYANRRQEAKRARLAQLDEQDRVTLVSIVEEVEAIRRKLGRAPLDQAELVSLLGQPMPVVHDGETPCPISYYRTGENSFLLQYEHWATDDWIYDSKTSAAGWVQHWY